MATRQYIGARYVPKFYTNSVDGSAAWESNVVYEPLTFVTLTNGHMYISKKQVPATVDTPASNIEYWLDMGSYNGFIEELQNEIDALNTALTSLTNRIVTPEQFGAVGDGVTDDTEAINDCLSSGTYYVLFKNGATYLIDPLVSVKPASNQKIDLNGATLKAKTVSEGTYDVIALDNVNDVLITNGTVIGDKTTHSGATGEWGHGVHTFNTCKNITVSNLVIKECWGDGVDFNTITNGIIENCEIYNCKRQGVTVGKCNNVIVRGNFIHDISGTSPESGIDVEPNNPDKAIDVLLEGNIIADCKIGISLSDGYTPSNLVNIKVIGNKISASGSGKTLIKTYGSNFIVTDNQLIGEDITAFYSSTGGEKNVISDNTFRGSAVSDGVQLYSTNKSTFSNNDVAITSTDCIILLYESNNNILNGNTIHDCETGTSYFICYMRGQTATSNNNIINSNTFKNVVARAVFGFAGTANDNKVTSNNVEGTYEAVSRGVSANTGDDFYFNVLKDGTSATHNGNDCGQYVQNIVDDTLVP